MNVIYEGNICDFLCLILFLFADGFAFCFNCSNDIYSTSNASILSVQNLEFLFILLTCFLNYFFRLLQSIRS